MNVSMFPGLNMLL